MGVSRESSSREGCCSFLINFIFKDISLEDKEIIIYTSVSLSLSWIK